MQYCLSIDAVLLCSNCLGILVLTQLLLVTKEEQEDYEVTAHSNTPPREANKDAAAEKQTVQEMKQRSVREQRSVYGMSSSNLNLQHNN